MSGSVIDIHSHVLPGIDDGPATIEASIALARAVAQSGTRTLVATPHVSWRHPNDSATIAPLVDELNAHLRTEEIELEIRAGAEIAMTRAAELDPAELARLTLGGGEWLLVECPFTPVATGMDALVFDLQRRGHRVVLAHPERCPAFHRDRRPLELLVHGGVLTSITAGSLVGRFGGACSASPCSWCATSWCTTWPPTRTTPSAARRGCARSLSRPAWGSCARWLTCDGAQRDPRRRRGPAATRDGGAAQASFTMAITIPMSTNTTIAACIQIQVGDIASSQDRWRGFSTGRRPTV